MAIFAVHINAHINTHTHTYILYITGLSFIRKKFSIQEYYIYAKDFFLELALV